MHVIQWARCPLIAENDYARRWLQSVADLGHARNTVEAYGRAVEEYLSFTKGLGVTVAEARRDLQRRVGGHAETSKEAAKTRSYFAAAAPVNEL